ncbi:MAG: glycosyltransferase family 39 protein [Candidatus Yanofskybacteria bacterium]|nr:glycosyltransferase family 39 protein [Candidatus Yanofskybacteria bacterium]
MFSVSHYKSILTVLLLLVFFIPFFSAQNFSPATDEIIHLPGGYSYWKTGEIVLNPEHPPLVKLMASFPLLFMDLKFDADDVNLAGPFKKQWTFGSKFLFSNDADRLLLWGRLPMMLLSVLLGFYIYKWGSEMFSRKAGLLALFLYAFMPVIITNAQFVTMDLPLASFSFITFYYLWKFVTAGLKKHLAYSGLFLGMALSSKFSATIFLPVVALFILTYAWQRGGELNVKMRRLANLSLIMAIPAVAVIYFSYLMPADSGFYLRGFKSVYANWKPDFNLYLNGKFSPDGWWYYFLEAFLIKTPIPALVAFAASILLYKKIKMDSWSKALVFLPMLFFAFVTSAKAQNISIRYLIPAIPFLILYAGGYLSKIFNFQFSIFNKFSIVNFKTILILVLAVWYAYSAFSIYPDYMPYFNEFIGGSKNGYKYLDDSNIEWGQDLKRLGKYQAKNPETKVIYSWSHSSPEYYRVSMSNFKQADESGWWREPKGRFAVNTFLLIRMQLLSEQKKDPALNWLALYEPVDKIGQSFFVYDFK